MLVLVLRLVLEKDDEDDCMVADDAIKVGGVVGIETAACMTEVVAVPFIVFTANLGVSMGLRGRLEESWWCWCWWIGGCGGGVNISLDCSW